MYTHMYKYINWSFQDLPRYACRILIIKLTKNRSIRALILLPLPHSFKQLETFVKVNTKTS